MDQLIRQIIIVILLPLPLAVFWLWMFRDMINNDYLTSKSRSTWMFEFVLLNVFAAALYYQTEYRNRH